MRKKSLRKRTLTPKRKLPAKPYKLGGRKIDNRELQDILDSLGMRMVPKQDFTPLEELENRVDRMLVRADAAFDAGKDASNDIKKFSEVFVPLINDVRKELGDVRVRVLAIENAAASLDKRVSALEQERTKGP